MASESDGFKAFMAKEVQVKRSYLYLLRFLFLFAWMTTALLVGRPGGFALKILAMAFATAILVSTIFYFTERYGDLSDRSRIVLSLIVLTVLAILIWRHETHKAGISKPNITDSSVVHPN